MVMPNIQTLLSNLISGDDTLAEAAAVEIGTLGVDAIPDLQELHSSSDADIRWWVTRTLALITDSLASTLLLESLRDTDSAVRQCAALALKEQPTRAAIPDLIAALDDPDRLLSRLAADALIAAGGEAVPALIEILESGEQRSQGEAARALALIEDEQAIPVMFEVWERGSSLVQHWIEEGFERMGVGMTFFQPK